MNKFICLLFLSLFTLDYLSVKLRILSNYVAWLPDVMSIAALVVVLGLFATGNSAAIAKRYTILLVLLLVVMFVGFVLNTVPAGAIVAGLRRYLKFVPFFLIPAFYPFTTAQIRTQVRWLLFLFAIQLPVTVYQRLFQYKGVLSGDNISGSLGTNSGQLSLLLISAISVVLSFRLKGLLSKYATVIIVLILLFPITMGETKGSLVLLPVAILFPVLLIKGEQRRKTEVMKAFLLLIPVMVIFVVVYDYFVTPRWGYGILDFLTMEGRVENYLYKGVETVGYDTKVGRLDSLVFAFQYLTDDIFQFLFGLGAGNLSVSFLGGFEGEYQELGAKYAIRGTNVTTFLWEIGVLGTLLYFTLIYMVFRDARRLSVLPGIRGALGLGWAAVMIIVSIGIFWKSIFGPDATGYLFWYISGYVVAESYRMRNQRMDGR